MHRHIDLHVPTMQCDIHKSTALSIQRNMRRQLLWTTFNQHQHRRVMRFHCCCGPCMCSMSTATGPFACVCERWLVRQYCIRECYVEEYSNKMARRLRMRSIFFPSAFPLCGGGVCQPFLRSTLSLCGVLICFRSVCDCVLVGCVVFLVPRLVGVIRSFFDSRRMLTVILSTAASSQVYYK